MLSDGDVERMVREGGVGDGRGGRSLGVSPAAPEGDVWGGIGIVFEERPLTTGFSKRKESPGGKERRGWERDWGLVVDALVEGGPAARSGLIAAGDVLEEVDGKRVLDMPIGKVAPVIMGPLRSNVTLGMRRAMTRFQGLPPSLPPSIPPFLPLSLSLCVAMAVRLDFRCHLGGRVQYRMCNANVNSE